MPTVTPTFNWPIPEDTDLVKDGAEAIRDLGNAIDTSAAGFGGGLVHINTTSFSAVASQSINDVFTNTYTNYRLIYNGLASAFSTFHLRLRASGSDTTTNYAGQNLQASSPNVTAFDGATNAASISAIHTTQSIVTVDIAGPELSQKTVMTAFGGPGSPRIDISTAVQTDSTSFDGFTLFPDVAQPLRTLTGTISVYGYAKA
jgi:hypothetical protein